MDFKAYDTRKIDEYRKQAKEQWGQTPAWKEYEKKSKGRTKEDEKQLPLVKWSQHADGGQSVCT